MDVIDPRPGDTCYRDGAMQPCEVPLRTVDWLLLNLVAFIPVIGLVLLIVWAVDRSSSLQRRRWAGAMLIFRCVLLIPLIIISVVFFSVVMVGLPILPFYW